ncbi:MAG: SPASM domain-containing protein [archaeon]|jgi:organic radical activating enzyme|nr:SPASM domain-containing protein [archaeon]
MTPNPRMEVTTKIGCSVRCSYCPQDVLIKAYKKTGGPTDLTMETFQECLNNTPTNMHITFNGMCEPWLNSHFTDMLLHTHETRRVKGLSTTLVKTTKEDLSRIKHIPIDQFTIHVPSDDDDMRVTVDDNYLDILETAINTMARQPSVLFFGKVHPEIKPLLKNVKKKGRLWNLHNRACHLESEVTRRRNLLMCNFLQVGVLQPNGDVVLCCNDYGMQHVLGNLTKQNWDSLYTGKEFQKISAGWKDPSSEILCWQCWNPRPRNPPEFKLL